MGPVVLLLGLKQAGWRLCGSSEHFSLPKGAATVLHQLFLVEGNKECRLTVAGLQVKEMCGCSAKLNTEAGHGQLADAIVLKMGSEAFEN